MSGCKKELSLENQQTEKTLRKFQLKAFYSDIPIDFIENDDIIKSESDLWAYVNDYVKDDVNLFTDNNTDVQVYQNDKKLPGLDDAILYRTYFIGSDSEGSYMRYLAPDYTPLRYRLNEMTDDYFILSVKWKHGATVYSRFERIP